MSIEYIDITITEEDLEAFKRIVYENDSFNWMYETDKGQYVTVRFMADVESDTMSDRDTQLENWSRERL